MKISRRRFLEALGGAALLGCHAPAGSASDTDPLRVDIGLELYTVDNAMKADFDGTLRRVAQIGYREVEFPWYYSRSASDVSASLKSAGLRCRSGLFLWEELEHELPAKIEFARSLGFTYMGCVMMPLPDASNLGQALDRLTVDDFRRFAEWLNATGDETRKAGMQLTYHNHDFEFGKFGSVVGYDELLRLTEPELVQMEMDVGWVVWAGYDPVEYLRTHAGRFSLLHVRDLELDAPRTPLEMHSVEAGNGVVDWPELLAAARDSGVKAGYVEQDPGAVSASFESARTSFDHLRDLHY
jgi:sugar phosphate isomerase/epimerase